MMEFPIFVQTLGFIIHPNLMVKEWCMKMSYKTMIYAEWISYVRQKWECKRIQTITNSRTQIIERNQEIYKSTFCKRMFVQVWPNNIIFETWGISVSEFDTGRNITNMRKSLNEPGHQLSLLVLIRCEKPTLAPFRVFTKVAPTPFWLIFSLFFFFFFFCFFLRRPFGFSPKEQRNLLTTVDSEICIKDSSISKMHFPWEIGRRHYGHHLPVD